MQCLDIVSGSEMMQSSCKLVSIESSAPSGMLVEM